MALAIAGVGRLSLPAAAMEFTAIGAILGLSPCATLGSLRSYKELVANALRSIRRRQSCKVPGSTPCTGAMVIGSVKQLPARRWGVRAGKPERDRSRWKHWGFHPGT